MVDYDNKVDGIDCELKMNDYRVEVKTPQTLSP